MNPLEPLAAAASDDPVAGLFAGLRDRDYASQGWCVLEGRIVIEKALAAGLELVALLTVPADEAVWRQRLANGGGVGADSVLRVMPRPQMERLVGFAFHRGALALARRPGPPARLPELAAGARRVSLALWQVSDPDNLGALIRSAAALGGAAVFLGPGCADPYGRKALRASMGCSLSLPLFAVPDLAGLRYNLTTPDATGASALPGPHLLAAALSPAAAPPGQQGLPGDTVLLLGNEGWGLPPELVAQCDAAVCIPMANGVDSLNVAAAGAILLWELCQSRPGRIK
jgi:tRNA G18 (ribose-2'-O)-methylase SpoU